jgi:hypothetical protein
VRDCGFDLEADLLPFHRGYYWSDVWERFQDELVLLEELNVHRTGDVYTRSSQPYISRNGGWLFNTVEQRREQAEDADALERLQATLELRMTGPEHQRLTGRIEAQRQITLND